MSDQKESYKSLKNSIGDSVQLQFSPGNENERYYVKLIGVMQDKSIMVTMPRIEGQTIRIPEGQLFVVRMVSGNSAHGFTASALRTSSMPFPYMHLSYPRDLQKIVVRKAERVNCKLIVSIHNEEPGKEITKISATMQDISTAGAQLVSAESLGEKGDTISITSKVSVAGVEQYLNIPGIIRRVVDTSGNGVSHNFEYGVEFSIVEDKDRLLLHGFVYEQMSKNNH